MDFNQFLTSRWKNLKLFDRNLVIFLFFMSVLTIVFSKNVQNWFLRFIVHLFFIFLLLYLLPYLDQKQNRTYKFIRYWYIIFAFPFLYWDIGPYLHVVFSREFDPLIIQIDKFFFGELPNIIIMKYVQPLLTEIMQISYGIYWITIPLGAAIFYFNKNYEYYEYLLYYVTITFFISYFFFIFFPVAGPRFYIADQISITYKGIFLTNYLRNFVENAAYRGGAFPSSHVGVAVVILIFMLYFKTKTALFVFFPLVIALSLATIYGQYHYTGDVISGLIMGTIIGVLGGHKTKKLLKSYDSY
jgi:membrane-associated phospholipid phosphatase